MRVSPQWIYVDLGKKEKIEHVVLKWETGTCQRVRDPSVE